VSVRRALSRLALVALGLAAVGLALEVGVRAVLGKAGVAAYRGPRDPAADAWWVDHPFLPYVGRPSAEYTTVLAPATGPVSVHVRNNAYGFRAHDLPALPLEKGPDDFVVVVLGESTTWGAYAQSNAETWPERLEAKLRAHDPSRDVRVFNLATPNATSAYSVVVLSLVGVHLRPDLVIAYHGFNDYGPAGAKHYRLDHAHFFRDLRLDDRFNGVQPMIADWMLRSHAVTYVTGLLDRRFVGGNDLAARVTHPLVPDDEIGREDVALARLARNWGHLTTIDALARGWSGRSLFATFQFFDGSDTTYARVNESLRRLFRERDMDYVDLDALIPDRDASLQLDACHFTAAGEERVAESFFRHIVDHGLLSR
jgi:lysophospholipase L1-like esterase